jgi:hypothetical protein
MTNPAAEALEGERVKSERWNGGTVNKGEKREVTGES